MKVNSNTEWGTLKEIIVGNVDNAQIPIIKKHDIHCVDYADVNDVTELPGGTYGEEILSKTAQELDTFANQLSALGITVHRPETVKHYKVFGTPDWQTDGYYSYCPRDGAIVIGDTIIETPMALRSRYYETFAYRRIFQKYFLAGSKWISAPKPQLHDSLYDRTDLSKPTLTETEPAFDAANIIKCGKDIFYLISNSGNRMGAQWLQTTLGDKYTVHVMDNIYAYVHVDTSILPLAPGKVLLNPARVNENNLPDYFKNWDKIYSVEPVVTSCKENWAPGSPWIGMNVLSLSEKHIAVEASQTGLQEQLYKQGFDILPVKLTHCRTLSGGPHCVTLDTVRDDQYADYS